MKQKRYRKYSLPDREQQTIERKDTIRNTGNQEYFLIPARAPKGNGKDADGFKGTHPFPDNWVRITGGYDSVNRKQMQGITGPVRRQFTEGYLNTRFNRNTTVEMRRNYVKTVLSNPRTPSYNREFIIDYVRRHPEKFTFG